VVKTVIANRAGVPDILICYKGKFVAFEVKSGKGRLSPLQELNLTNIINNGGQAHCVRSLAEVEEVMSNLG